MVIDRGAIVAGAGGMVADSGAAYAFAAGPSQVPGVTQLG
jgi:hypothetical protein